MGRKNYIVTFVVAAVFATVVAVLLVMWAGGESGENGVTTPNPTASVVPSTVTPSMPTPTTAPPTPAPPTSVVSPSTAPVAARTVVIRALSNPYRFEPSQIELEGGKIYTLEFIGGDEKETFFITDADLYVTAEIPAHGTASVTFFIRPEPKVYYFYSGIHEKNGMGGNIIVK